MRVGAMERIVLKPLPGMDVWGIVWNELWRRQDAKSARLYVLLEPPPHPAAKRHTAAPAAAVFRQPRHLLLRFCIVIKKPAVSSGFRERMMGLEPTTFCMASRRSSQLSYIRARRQYSPR